MEDLGHFRVGKEGKPLTILQATDSTTSAVRLSSMCAWPRARLRYVRQLDSTCGPATLIARVEPDVVLLTGDIA